jgi:nitroreductase
MSALTERLLFRDQAFSCNDRYINQICEVCTRLRRADNETSHPERSILERASRDGGGMNTDFDLSITDRLLTTTRSVRRRLDLARPVEDAVLDECFSIALQAATGGDLQRWRWVIVRDGEKRRRFGEIYRRAFLEMLTAAEAVPAETEKQDEVLHEKFNEDLAAKEKLMASVNFLIEHMGEVPAIVVPCVIGRVDGEVTRSWVSSQFGSVYPAVWNLQLALRSRGLGSCITAAHLEYEEDVAELLSIPFEAVMQVCALPVAYYAGTTFGRARRRPQHEVVFTDTFDPASMADTGW